MAASIGKGSLILSTDATKLDSGLAGAFGKIKSWGEKLQSGLSGIGGGIGGKLGLGGIGSGIIAGLGRLGPIAAVAAAGFAAVKEGVQAVTDGLSELAAYNKSAKSLGVDPSTYMGLAKAAERAGLQLPEFGNLLAKMQAKVAAGGSDVAGALSSIGLTVGQIQNMSATQAFFAIATGLSQTGDAGVRASVAMKLFEESGLRLLPMLQKGESGLRAFIEEQKKTGAVLSNKELGEAGGANGAVQAATAKIESAFDGLWNRILVAAAPAVTAIADAVSSLVDRLQPVFDWLGRAAGAFGDGMGILAEEVGIAFDSIADGIAEMMGDVAGGLGIEFPSIAEVVTGAMRTMGVVGGYAFDALKVGVGAVKFALSPLVDAFGLLVRGIENLLDVAGKLPDSLGGADFRKAALDAQRLREGAHGLAADMRKSAEDALRGFGATAARVNAKFDKLGKEKELKVNTEEAEQKIGQLAGAMEKVAGGKKNLLEAIFKGSKEDYSLRVNFDANRMKDVGEKQLKEQQEMNKKMAEAVRHLGVIARTSPTELAVI